MHRRPLLDLLTQYREAYPAERAVANRMIALVEDHADCLDRTCRPGHVTGSAWVVSADGERHLLMHHRKLDKWLQPGGHADGQADLAEVAIREAQEETGLQTLKPISSSDDLLPLDLDIHRIPARFDASGREIDDAHEHHDVRFLLQAASEEKISPNDEAQDLRWCTPAEVRRLTDEISVLRLLDKARERLVTQAARLR